MLWFEKESKKIEELVKFNLKFLSVEELELKIEKVSREFEKKDDKF